jgi:hypothetical protein
MANSITPFLSTARFNRVASLVRSGLVGSGLGILIVPTVQFMKLRRLSTLSIILRRPEAIGLVT